jgi:hypothetical protein
MGQPSRHALHVREAREHLSAFRARLSALGTSVHHSVLGTVHCIVTSRELMADLDDQIRKLNGG